MNSTSRVSCFPLPNFSEKSPIDLVSSFNNALIKDDLPTADCPHKTTFLLLIMLATSSTLMLLWLDT